MYVEYAATIGDHQETIIIDFLDDELETEAHGRSPPTEPPTFRRHDRVVCQWCGNLVTWSYLPTHMYEMHYYIPDVTSPAILCAVCGVMCKDNRTFLKHKRLHYLKCPKCPLRFKTEDELKKHSPLHVEKQYECTKCSSSFDDCYSYVIHKETHDKSGEYSCVKCSVTSRSLTAIRKHLMRHVGRQVYTCQVCERKFFGKARFDMHVETHGGVHKYKCDYCSKKFATMNYLKTHRELNHHKELYGFEMTYPCRECGRKFKFENSLKRHLSTIHKIGEDRCVTCPVCRKKIANNYNLKVHMRMHTGEKTNMCDSCGKAYSTYKSYKKHVLKHHPWVQPKPKSGSAQ